MLERTLKVTTDLGQIIVTNNTDENYAGIYVDFLPHGCAEETERPIAHVEVTQYEAEERKLRLITYGQTGYSDDLIDSEPTDIRILLTEKDVKLVPTESCVLIDDDHRLVYGYTRLNSRGKEKQTETFLFVTEAERDEQMYADYADSFGRIAEESPFSGRDCCGFPKLKKKEFLKALNEAKNKESGVFGYIQASDDHVQFEPFCRYIT